ncbi:hypothetical protein LCGC14_1970790 [marine sediment metagenome]|uniref:Uncharacterized protein n=1 Tax=marine sediment metagenome TaxID=412755 RepID=A0A0F9G002_9ZZZZ
MKQEYHVNRESPVMAYLFWDGMSGDGRATLIKYLAMVGQHVIKTIRS